MQTRSIHRFPFFYQRSKLILIILALFLPLVAIVLLMKNGGIATQQRDITFEYLGSYFWLIFWCIVFAPIAAILFLLNGVNLIEVKNTNTDLIVEKF